MNELSPLTENASPPSGDLLPGGAEGEPGRFRFHLVTLAHLPQSRAYSSCAYTQKNRKLARMLTSRGHTVIFYGAEGSDVEDYCAGQPGELYFIPTHTLADIAEDYGNDPRYEIGYDHQVNHFRADFAGPSNASTLKFLASCIYHINRGQERDDFLLLTMGHYHDPIREALHLPLSCEPGIGYLGSNPANYRCFESECLRSFMYGSENPAQTVLGNWWDRVIPNYFDPDDYEYRADKGDYALYLGRMMTNKGLSIALETCKQEGIKLVLAGQGARVERRHLVLTEEEGAAFKPGPWEYVGVAGPELRKELLAGARAVFVPTQYLEPFGGVSIEAMLSGTPPLTSNFGAFPEHIPAPLQGKVGFRCNTPADYRRALQAAPTLDPAVIRRHGERYLLEPVTDQFQRWFEDLYHLSRG